MRLTGRKLLAAMALSSIIAAAGYSANAAAPESSTGVVPAFTEPSKRSEMNFISMGIIKQVAVKEGDSVKMGQVLMTQDDDIEMAELERLKLEADSTARLDFAKADLDVKKKVAERKTKAEGGVFSQSEIEEAQLDVVQREKQIDVTNLDLQGNKLKAKQQQIKVDKMQLHAQMDGLVEKIKIWEGEVAAPDRDKPAIIIVKNDPCNVVIRELTTRQVAQLSLGESLEVKYPDEKDWQQAKISYIAPVADAASDTQVVKLELPNPQNRATGLPIQVRLPAKLAAESGADKTASR